MARRCYYKDQNGNEIGSFGDGEAPPGATITGVCFEEGSNQGGGGGNGGMRAEDPYDMRFDFNPDAPPNTFYSPQSKRSVAMFMDNARWKRQQLKSLLNMYRNQHPKQIDAYKKALQIDPQHRESYIYLSSLYENTQDYNQAIQILKQFLKVEPNSIDSLLLAPCDASSLGACRIDGRSLLEDSKGWRTGST